MEQQSDETRLAIEEANLVRELGLSSGWKIVDKVLKDAIEALRLKRSQSDDPSFVMACVRQEDGIMLVNEVIHEFIIRGEEIVT